MFRRAVQFRLRTATTKGQYTMKNRHFYAKADAGWSTFSLRVSTRHHLFDGRS